MNGGVLISLCSHTSGLSGALTGTVYVISDMMTIGGYLRRTVLGNPVEGLIQNGTSSVGTTGSSTALASLFSAGPGPRNCTRDATISVRLRLPPLFLISNSRVRGLPST